jgi:hypothetical protein
VTKRLVRLAIQLTVCLVLVAGMARAERLIGEGDPWRYYKGTNMPSAAATWTTNGFDDSSWPTGPSGFGYGDSDDATVLADMTNSVGGYVTVFTRKTFVIPDTNAVTTLTLGVDYDDGFVAYLNGNEIARRTNTTVGPISFNTVASGNHEASRGSPAQPKEFIAINTTNLVTGTNTLAVVGNNVSTNSSDFSLIVDLATTGPLTRGPYVQMPVDGEAVIVWRTAAASDSAVDFGLDTGCGTGTSSNAALVTEHAVTLTGLLPGTNYFFRVRSAGVTLAADSFPTKRTGAQPFRVIIIGDFGSGLAGMSNIAARVNNTPGDLLLTVGDNIYPAGAPADYDPKWFSQYWQAMRRMPTFPALGNHDVDQGAYNGQAYLDNFYLPTNGPAGQIERNYSFDYGNAHFTVVDSNPYAEGNTALYNTIRTWASNDLASTTQQWKIVYFHHPPYTSSGGSAHGDNTAVKTNLWPVFRTTGVDIVFDGHNHFYERMDPIDGTYEVLTGGGGQSLYAPSITHAASVTRNATVNSFSVVDINGSLMTVCGLDANGNQIDQTTIMNKPFRMDGIIDSTTWLRAQNGLKLYAAIRGRYLYLATQDAGEGSDHFIYLNNILTTNRSANWAKAGSVMQWSAFLADENDNHYTSWYGNSGQTLTNPAVYQSRTPGYNNNNTDINGSPTNGVLEGMIDVATHFGAFPQQVYVAAAPFATADGGVLVTNAQVPGMTVTNLNVDPSEFLSLNTRDLALDLPVADAGTNQTVEAGMTVVLNGSASAAPSGLLLGFAWTQLSGPVVSLTGSSNAIAAFAAASNVASNTDLVFRLTVDDTRFDSNSLVTVTLTPMVDSDGDGLSDTEEATGQDNVLTAANPNGQITNPLLADTDGDGANDGDEAIAGTDPNSAASVFRIISVAIPGGFALEWSTVIGKTYVVEFRDDLGSIWASLTNFVANTGLTNLTDTSAVGQPQRFYRVQVLP